MPVKELQVPVRYIGAKPVFIDRLYGTGKRWSFSEEVAVPVSVAIKLLTHTEFEDARIGDKLPPLKTLMTDVTEDEPEDELERDMPLVNLEQLTKAELLQYAQRNFGVELDSKNTKAQLVDTVRLQMGKRA